MDRHQAAARSYLRHVLDTLGINATRLAAEAGVSSTTLTRFLNSKDIKHSLSARTLERIAHASGIALPRELGGAAEMTTSQKNPIAGGEAAGFTKVVGTPPGPGPRDLPVRGMAEDMGDTSMFNPAVTVAYVERPWFLLSNPSAYALYMIGNTMAPAFRHGWTLYVNPTVPVAVGDEVAIVLKNGTGLVKCLVSRNGSETVVSQYNPPLERTIPTEQISQIHAIQAALRTRT